MKAYAAPLMSSGFGHSQSLPLDFALQRTPSCAFGVCFTDLNHDRLWL
jgi:hypothetical protein